MKYVRRVTFLACALSLVPLAAHAHAGAADEKSCSVPGALRSAGLLPEATAAYEQLLDDNGRFASCAVEGLDAIRAARTIRARTFTRALADSDLSSDAIDSLGRLIRDGREDDVPSSLDAAQLALSGVAIANALRLSGYPSAAGSVLADAIAAKPDLKVPEELTGLSDAGLHLAAAEALSRAGLDGEAQDELELALKSDPSLTVPDSLAQIDRREPFWREFLGAVGPFARTAVEILIAVLALVAVALLCARIPRLLKARLVLTQFSGGGKDSTTGADLGASVREQYTRLAGHGGGVRLNRVSAPGEQSSGLPKEVGDAYPQTRLLAALVGLVGRLVPSRVREVDGYVRPRDPKRGAGLSLTFARRYGKVFDERSFWEADFGTPLSGKQDPGQRAYDQLALPAAVWLIYQGGRRSVLRLGRRKFRILGTPDWQSYALFALGADDDARGDPISAAAKYRRALAHDGGNIGAAFNLAAIEHLDDRSAGSDGAAGRRLARVATSIERAGREQRDPNWYRVRYLQAAVALEGGEVGSALETAADLTVTLAAERRRIAMPLATGSADALHEFLTEVQPRILVILASAIAEQRAADEEVLKRMITPKQARSIAALLEPGLRRTSAGLDAWIVRSVTASDELDIGAMFNLACYHARTRAWLTEGGGDSDTVWDYLIRAAELGGARVIEEALDDPALNSYFAVAEHREQAESWLQDRPT